MKNSKQQSGFTLIELLIVIAIIGILSAVALPLYQNYVARSQLVEAVNIGSATRTAIDDYLHVNGALPATADLDALVGEGRLTDAGVATDGAFSTINNITIEDADGELGNLVLTLKPAGLRPEVVGKKVTWARSAIGWDCSVDVAAEIAPKNCDSSL